MQLLIPLLIFSLASPLLGSIIPIKMGDVTGIIIVSRRLPDELGWPQPPIEATRSTVTVCLRSAGPAINSIEVTVNYRINGERRSETDYIRNAPLPHPAGCALEIVKEPSTAGILILESVEFKEQPATSHQKYVVNQDR